MVSSNSLDFRVGNLKNLITLLISCVTLNLTSEAVYIFIYKMENTQPHRIVSASLFLFLKVLFLFGRQSYQRGETGISSICYFTP